MNYRETVEETVDDLNEEIEQKTIDMENLQEAVTHLEVRTFLCRKRSKAIKNSMESSRMSPNF